MLRIWRSLGVDFMSILIAIPVKEHIHFSYSWMPPEEIFATGLT